MVWIPNKKTTDFDTDITKDDKLNIDEIYKEKGEQKMADVKEIVESSKDQKMEDILYVEWESDYPANYSLLEEMPEHASDGMQYMPVTRRQWEIMKEDGEYGVDALKHYKKELERQSEAESSIEDGSQKHNGKITFKSIGNAIAKYKEKVNDRFRGEL